MKLDIYHIDAFTQRLFSGNPAAVIPLDAWLDDKVMQQIAAENNLSETAFFVPSVSDDADYEIRWFTPTIEINLCGHATLASAFVLFEFLNFSEQEIQFSCKSGRLQVAKRGERIVMDFPAWKPKPANDVDLDVMLALGINPSGYYRNRDLLIEVESPDDVRKISPDFTRLKQTGERVIVTAEGNGEADFVSRFFAPAAGINEDPVTGSAHSQLIPFWSERLGKTSMFAKQLSPRGGDIWCEHLGDRVTMSGYCVFYMQGALSLAIEQFSAEGEAV